MFFDDHPEFLETSITATGKNRLNLRHLGIIEENASVLRGASVLDIASHDGRWSFAALEAGARHVIGIEGRPRLTRQTRKTFAAKGVDPERYDLITGDVHEEIHHPLVKADVVMCLGFLYHTARYVELMAGIASTRAEYVIIDTRVITGVEGPLVQYRTERFVGESLAIRDRYAQAQHVISAVPSEAALVVMLEAIGYEVDHRTDWPALLSDHPDPAGISQYANGTRVTFRARRIH